MDILSLRQRFIMDELEEIMSKSTIVKLESLSGFVDRLDDKLDVIEKSVNKQVATNEKVESLLLKLSDFDIQIDKKRIYMERSIVITGSIMMFLVIVSGILGLTLPHVSSLFDKQQKVLFAQEYSIDNK
jgi:hypothetical protein